MIPSGIADEAGDMIQEQIQAHMRRDSTQKGEICREYGGHLNAMLSTMKKGTE